MKILHYQHMGVGVVLSNEMNTHRGITSKVLSTYRHPFGFKANYTTPPIPHIAHFLLAHYFPKRFNILHSHDGFPLPMYVLNKWKGRFVQHYHNPMPDDFYPDTQVPAFVSTQCALSRIPDSIWMPLPVDTTKLTPSARLYDPTNLKIGYSYNIHADKNKLKYIPHEELQQFSLTHNVTLFPLSWTIHHTYMPSYYHAIDIYIDRFGLNSYGWQAVEAAACGCIIVTQSTHHPDDCPFTQATRETLPNVLEAIITLPVTILSNMKQQSIAYAHKYHDLSTVATKCIRYYESLGDINEYTNPMGYDGNSFVQNQESIRYSKFLRSMSNK